MDEPTERSQAQTGETYEEYTSCGARLAVITDRDNDRAWIQSSLTVPVER